jgi:hypothetical protein
MRASYLPIGFDEKEQEKVRKKFTGRENQPAGNGLVGGESRVERGGLAIWIGNDDLLRTCG